MSNQQGQSEEFASLLDHIMHLWLGRYSFFDFQLPERERERCRQH